MSDLSILRLERTEYHRAYLNLSKLAKHRLQEHTDFLKETKERWEAYVTGNLTGADKAKEAELINAYVVANKSACIAKEAYWSADRDYHEALSKISQN